MISQCTGLIFNYCLFEAEAVLFIDLFKYIVLFLVINLK